MSNLEYNGQVLTTARGELKLKVDDIATELCLSVEQVRSIENNLGKSFKKYLYISIAAFMTTIVWKLFA